ncbi:MAG TPA: sulfotransferase [Isosphaeraceae bacterium]|nr:sulfotransferase [Isosphaeraceae bacterium]
MAEKVKDFIGRYVFHPLQGMTLGDWWAVLRRHRFAIDLQHLPRALVQTAFSISNSVNARIELRRFGRRIEAARVETPLFILGHYRSGTTHLHNLLALDPQFAAPTLFQVLNPHTFLSTERWVAPVADRLIGRRRCQDEMAQSTGVPSEDEFALCTMTGLSPYMGWCFPGDGVDYGRYLTFRGVTDEEVARWEHALTTFLKKLTVRFGRSLVLKSPPHTARIRLLLGLFPDARFVNIHRNPYVVFRSERHTIRVAQPFYHLRDGPIQDSDDRIISVYTEMYDAYFEERGLIPEGRLCDVAFEDLEREPVGVIGSIYESLGLSGFEELRPRLEGYLASIAGYRKNRHDELEEPLRRRIAQDWSRSFDEWGYER